MTVRAVALAWAWISATSFAVADTSILHSFQRHKLTDVYYSEGVAVGDVNGDGVMDVVHGPYWFAGPSFETRHEIYEAKAQPREAYADNFFSWIYDFNRDGHNDVFVVGFPGTPAFVYVNPGGDATKTPWEKRQVFDWVSNESPHFTQLIGDEQPELVCTRDGRFGYATFDPVDGLKTWTFHAISDDIATKRFGHGLGVGDVNGDGRLDVIMKDGWFEQPASLDNDPLWKLHRAAFSAAGGAEMFAYDVDGDGDNDVITSLEAHSYGLAWHEQLRDGDSIAFRQHTIMGKTPEENPYGVLFTEPHSVQLADIDGDGLKDIITGKTYWSHHTQSPLWDAGAVVYWFRLARGKNGDVDWVPHLADGEAGIGRQIVVADVNADGLLDIATGGMKGCHVLTHQQKEVSEAEWRAAQPRRVQPLADGLAPEEAAARMTVPEGFHVTLAAGEPQIHQPIAFTIDHRGRLWVAEAYTYPIRAPEGEGRDKIVILEDTDADGSLDKRTVFIDGLNLVSGLEVGFGGVWVGAAPYLLYIPDKNADDVPDSEPTVLLDGFGYQDTHETLNSFIWGPDGWLYGCHGVFTHSKVGIPGTPDSNRTPLNAGVWRYHPTRNQFEVFAHGTSNPWGVDFDEHGQAFITACVIPHLYHVIQGARYQRQGGQHFNPHTYDDIKTIADHAHYVGNIRDHAWWGNEPQAPADTLAAGGGHAHCGAMIYLGDNWPAEYRGGLFMNNIHGNRVNHDRLERHGSGFVGHHSPDFLLANDRWYRGINLKYGPDGGVYLIDWYDKNACHRTNPEIWDRTNGRIYKITYGKPDPVEVDLAKLSDEELIKLQNHDNEWYVRMSRRLLQERLHRVQPRISGDSREEQRETIAKFVEANSVRVQSVNRFDELIDQATPAGRLRLMWLKHIVGHSGIANDLSLLNDENEYVRAWAVQLLGTSAGLTLKLAEMARDDESPLVRLYIASLLQHKPLDERWYALTSLVQHDEDADDHNLPLMYWYAIEPLVKADPARAMQLAALAKIPLIQRFIIRRAASEPDTLEFAIAALTKAKDDATQQMILDEMLRAFEGRVDIPMPKSWTPAYDTLMKSESAAIRDRADQVAVLLGDSRIFPRMRTRLTSADSPIKEREQALAILVRGRDPQAAAALQAVLDQPKLRGAAIRALAAYDDPNTPAALLARYRQLPEAEQRDAIGTLVSRPSYALALLAAIDAERVPRTDLHAYHIRQLRTFENEQLDNRIREVWGEIRETSADRQAKIAEWKKQLTQQKLAAADVSNGRRVFTKTCAACHTLFGEGGKVGPDITGSNRANLDYILENILDPSAVLGKDYRMSVFALSDGRVISGLVLRETDSALTVRTINDEIVIAKKDIEEQQLSPLSLMPEGQLDQMPPSDAVDLIAYLGSPTQVALKGSAAPIDAKTGRVPGAVEGESMKIIGKTGGAARGQNMSPFPKDRWSGNDHLWWTGAKPGDRLDLEMPVAKAGEYELEIVLTKARDYGIVQLSVDGLPLGPPIDLFNAPDVITTGVLTFGPLNMKDGSHKLSLEITGANPAAAKAYMVGLDFVRLVESNAHPNSAAAPQ